ncbi:MAG: hypothetical protein EA412_09075 [Chitinophagaceae bacterium]|nr:MAG: hypothetical protein EA412_09075 [Chitinophagaceae bacterium]
MGLIASQGIKNSIWSYIGMLVGYLNVILLLPNILPLEQVGLIRVLIDVSVIFAHICAFGMANVLIRNYPAYKDSTKMRSGFFGFMHIWIFIGFLIFSFLFFLFKEPILDLVRTESPLVIDYYLLIFPIALFSLYFNMLDIYSRANLSSVYPSFLRDVILRIALSVLLVFYYFQEFNFELFLLFFTATYFLIALMQFLFLKKKNWYTLSFVSDFFSTQKLKPVLKYGFFTLMAGLSSILIAMIDTVMLTGLVGLDAVAIYATSFFMAAAITVPARSLYKIVFPIVSDKWMHHKREDVLSIYRKTSVANVLTGGFIFLWVVVNHQYIYKMMPDVYAQGFIVFIYVGIGKLFEASAGIGFMILSVSEKYKFDTFFNLLLLILAVVLNYFLISAYGLSGAAIASFLSLVIINTLRLITIAYFFKLFPFYSKTILACVICIVCFFAGWIIPEFSSFWVNIIIKSFVMFAVFVFLCWKTNIYKLFNEELKSV